MESISFFDIILIGFATWKIHDLCFHFGELRREKRLNRMLIKFYAEHVYKVMNQKTEYNEAPQDIYDWLSISFTEWQGEKSERKLNNNKES